MDATKFTEPTGQLVSIVNGTELAFVPGPLPRHWEPTGRLIKLWVEAREVLGELRGTGRTLPDHALLIRPLRQREALRSSSLEGTYATPAELLAYEKDPRDPHSSKDPANVWREVFNYQTSLETGQKLVEDGYPFSEWFIRQLHEILLKGVRGDDKSPGQIRQDQVYIGAGHRFTPPPHEHLPVLMGQLERDMKEETDIDPLIRSFMVHYQFETIHPFRDGNGRVGRLLLALMIYKECGLGLPWLYLSEYFERYKDEYIDNLFNVSAQNKWDEWIGFCLQATIKTGRETITRINKLLDLKHSYEERIKTHDGRDRLVHLLPYLMSSPVIRYEDLRRKLNVSYPTARADMDALIKMGIVQELPGTKSPKMYYATEIFKIAYLDGDA